MSYAQILNSTNGQQKAHKANQVLNNSDGFVFQVTPWERLRRFLICGSENNTYYQTAQRLTQENLKNLIWCLERDPLRVLTEIRDVSTQGLAPKNDHAILALCLATKSPDKEASKFLEVIFPNVVRTATHLMQFCSYVKELRGWGRFPKRLVAKWYQYMNKQKLEYQVMKYRNRHGYTHRDIFRLSHPKPPQDREALFKYIAASDDDKQTAINDGLVTSAWLETAHKLRTTTNLQEALHLLKTDSFPWEVLNTALLNEPEIWKQLLTSDSIPLMAQLRNMRRFCKIGLMKTGFKAEIAANFSNPDFIHRSRIHPLQFYAAEKVLRDCGASGVTEVLERAAEFAFANVEPTNKRYLLGLDVSGSMNTPCFSNLTAREVGMIMSIATFNAEENTHLGVFSSGFSLFEGTPRRISLRGLESAVRQLSFDWTDCAAPMLAATQLGLDVDVFVVYTDNETNCGDVHPYEALKRYRQKSSIPAKLAVFGLTSTDFTIADPDDAGMMDFVGFDSSAPKILSYFASEDLNKA